MRLFATLLLIVVLGVLAPGLSVSTSGQNGGPPAPGIAQATKAPPEPSEVLMHSPFGGCSSVGPSAPDTPQHLRLVTWNIRAALSAPVDSIAAELAAMEADVIALQEVDVDTRRSDFVDQPTALATRLGLYYAFAASIKWDGGDYGLAVLSRWPLIDVQRHRLDATTSNEPRIVLEAAICVGGRAIHLFDHHADGWAASRELGFAELRRLVQPYMGRGVLVFGDFNEAPDGPGARGLIEAGLVDLSATAGSSFGRRRVDFVLADRPLAGPTATSRVWPTNKSDHNAVVADLEW